MRANRMHRPARRQERVAPPLPSGARPRTIATVLACFVCAFTLFEIGAVTRRSATWDEPIHLTAGYMALAQGDYRIDPSHPPFLRMWAALPLLVMRPAGAETSNIERTPREAWFDEAYQFAHRFLYRLNDADQLLFAARSMIVVLGIVLGVLVFSWAYQWLGLWPALFTLTFYALEPNLFAHAGLVTTDLGVTCFIFGTAYFLWRTCRQPTATNVLGLAASVALAGVSKFSAVLLAPIVALLLVAAVAKGTISARRAVTVVAVLAITTYVAIWAVYGFRYAPSPSEAWLLQIENTTLAARVPWLTRIVSWVDAQHLLPNAFSQGFLFSQASVAEWPAYLSGQISTGGWWYYFPVAFLLKTPTVLIVLVAAVPALWLSQPHLKRSLTLAFLFVPLTVYLVVAMASGINMGIRHILPVYPFILLLAAATVRHLLATSSHIPRLTLVVLVVFSTIEVVRAYPRPLTFFNTFAGGPENGFRYLADSNLAWGGDLMALKSWMDVEQVGHVNLAYFGTADPAYYGINCTYLPGSPTFAIDLISKPRLPGYVAISPTILVGVYLEPQWRLFYSAFSKLEPAAVIGNTMRVYWVDSWPENGTPGDPNVQRALGDALLFGMQWPALATRHYRAYLARHPADADVLTRMGVALAESGHLAEAIDLFTRVTELAPGNVSATLNLEKARRRAALTSVEN